MFDQVHLCKGTSFMSHRFSASTHMTPKVLESIRKYIAVVILNELLTFKNLQISEMRNTCFKIIITEQYCKILRENDTNNFLTFNTCIKQTERQNLNCHQ